MLLKKRRFTWVELVLIIGALVILILLILPPLSKALYGSKGIRPNCVGNLKQIGLALAMYSGDHPDTTDQWSYGGWFPAHHPNGGNNFEPLAALGYIQDGKVWTCPSRTDTLTTAADSGYIYLGSGLKDTDPQPKTTSLAHDRPDNHPKGWANVLFIDGHVEGGLPGEKPFLPAK